MGQLSQTRRFRSLWRLAIALLAAASFTRSPRAQTQPDTTLGVALRNLASRAGVVFVGQVTGIGRSGDVVLVHLRVDQPLLGAAAVEYVLREWAGLWPQGEQRYYPGQRAIFFLHAPSASGFSSPVDGAEGVVPVLPQGASATPLVDTRRLDARLLRAAGDPLPAAASSAVLLTDTATIVQGFHNPTWREPIRQPLPIEALPPAPRSAAPILLQPTPQPVSVSRIAPSVPKPRAPIPPSPRLPLLPEPYAPR